MSIKWAYLRVSTPKQNLERQERNILAFEPNAKLVKEIYTGTSMDRPHWNWLMKEVKPGDTIIFDSVSRMSRTADEGFKIYMELYNKDVALIFLKERHIDTQAYHDAITRTLSSVSSTGNASTDKLLNSIISAVNEFMMTKVEDDIKKAFDQAEKEVDDLHDRISEGLLTARMNGKEFGVKAGTKLTTKKEKKSKPLILKYSKAFGGPLNDKECMKQIGLANNTYYKYKNELLEEHNILKKKRRTKKGTQNA